MFTLFANATIESMNLDGIRNKLDFIFHCCQNITHEWIEITIPLLFGAKLLGLRESIENFDALLPICQYCFIQTIFKVCHLHWRSKSFFVSPPARPDIYDDRIFISFLFGLYKIPNVTFSKENK